VELREHHGDRHTAEGRQHGRGHLDSVQPLSAHVAHDDAYSGLGLDHLVEVAPDERLMRGREDRQGTDEECRGQAYPPVQRPEVLVSEG
jgi:hypothetical protein